MFRDLALGLDQGLYLAAGPQGVVAGEEQLPDSVSHPGHGMGGSVPAVEVPHEPQLLGGGGPLPVHPALLVAVDAEVEGSVGELAQGAAAGEQGGLDLPPATDPPFYFAGVGPQLRVVVQNGVHGTLLSRWGMVLLLS